jgi:hypothetical protein
VALAGVAPEDISDCPIPTDLALAYGAALGLSDKANSVNFRSDHMPFLGKKLRMQKAVRFLSISLTILLLSVGVFVHSMLLRENRNREALRVKFEPDYLAVMLGKAELPDSMKQAVNDLEKTLRRLKAEKTGVGMNQESISAKLTSVLQAVNSCAKDTDLNVDSITISESNIIISGATSSRRNTVTKLFPAMEKMGLKVTSQNVNTEGGRDSFSVTLSVEKLAQGT